MERGGKITVVGKTVIEGEHIQARVRVIEHFLGGIEEAQAFEVLMDGHGGVLFEDAAQVIG